MSDMAFYESRSDQNGTHAVDGSPEIRSHHEMKPRLKPYIRFVGIFVGESNQKPTFLLGGAGIVHAQ